MSANGTVDRHRPHFFRRNATPSTVVVSNLSIVNIPTQATRVFVKVKQGRLAGASTPSVEIVGNAAEWKSELRLTCKVPHQPTRKKNLLLRFSVRLEDPSGRGHTRYGIAEQDLASIVQNESWLFHTQLQQCNYRSEFRCTIVVHGKITARISRRRERFHSVDLGALPHPPSLKATSADSLVFDRWTNDSSQGEGDDEDVTVDDFPFPVTEEKLDVLLKQVEEVWTGVINRGKKPVAGP
jgi:hypothetical protein